MKQSKDTATISEIQATMRENHTDYPMNQGDYSLFRFGGMQTEKTLQNSVYLPKFGLLE